MKVQGAITTTQTIKGSISKAELLAFVRETVHIPSNAAARFYVVAPAPYLHQGAPVSSFVDVTEDHRLQFTIEWSLPHGPSEQG